MNKVSVHIPDFVLKVTKKKMMLKADGVTIATKPNNRLCVEWEIVKDGWEVFGVWPTLTVRKMLPRVH